MSQEKGELELTVDRLNQQIREFLKDREIMTGTVNRLTMENEKLFEANRTMGEKLGRLDLTPTIRHILGQPCFAVRNEAKMLRDAGYAHVDTKAEDEQAVAIYWMLNLYLEHGSAWRVEGGKQVKAFIEKIEAITPKAAEVPKRE